MAERYKELYKLPHKLYIEGCPLVIEAGAIQEDCLKNAVLIQIKFLNVSDFVVKGCKVRIRTFEIGGNETEGIDQFLYLDVSVGRGKSFGSKTPIYLDNNTTRKFSPEIVEVYYENDSVWKNDLFELKELPEQDRIENRINDKEVLKQYRMEFGNTNCDYYPFPKDDLFLCTCGTISRIDLNCSTCKRKPEDVLERAKIDILEKKCEQRLVNEQIEKEEKERKRLEQEEQEKKRKKQIVKYTMISAIALILILLVILTVAKLILPEVNRYKSYQNANVLLDQGSYDEAKNLFVELGEYKNSSEMVNEVAYRKADMLFSEMEYDAAINEFLQIRNYKDSEDRIKAIKYAKAEAYINDAEYEEALIVYEELNDDENIKSCRKLMADSLFDNEEYDLAYDIYLEINDLEQLKIIDEIRLDRKKVEAKDEINNKYVKENYREAEQIQLDELLNSCNDRISEATDEESISSIVSEFLSEMGKAKTDEQYLKEEKEAQEKKNKESDWKVAVCCVNLSATDLVTDIGAVPARTGFYIHLLANNEKNSSATFTVKANYKTQLGGDFNKSFSKQFTSGEANYFNFTYGGGGIWLNTTLTVKIYDERGILLVKKTILWG